MCRPGIRPRTFRNSRNPEQRASSFLGRSGPAASAGVVLFVISEHFSLSFRTLLCCYSERSEESAFCLRRLVRLPFSFKLLSSECRDPCGGFRNAHALPHGHQFAVPH